MTDSPTPPGRSVALDELFIKDAKQHCGILLQALTDVGGSSLPSADGWRTIEQSLSSLKGSASVIGLEPIRRLAAELQRVAALVATDGVTPVNGRLNPLNEAVHLLAALLDVPGTQLLPNVAASRDRVEALIDGLIAIDGAEADLGFVLVAATSVPPEVDPEILELFRIEAEACLATLERELVSLEGGNPQGLEALMRAAHSIKGSARIVGTGAVAELAHAMEEVFVAAQHSRLSLSPNQVDLLLTGTDLMGELTRDLEQLVSGDERNGARVRDVVRALERAVRGGNSSVVPALNPPVASKAPGPAAAAVTIARSVPTASTGHLNHASQSGQERVVRVAAQSINRLMGLAGESLVESRRVKGLGNGALTLKRKQRELSDLLDVLSRRAQVTDDPKTSALVSAAQACAGECRGLLQTQADDLDGHVQRVGELGDRLYREALKSRMRPFGDCTHGLPRMVRDVARQLGKQVRLLVSGEGTEVDRDVLESLEGPLSHLLRNAVDHGIESEQVRVAAAKPPVGTIRLEARHHAGMLAIAIRDDGGGISAERVRRKVIERGLLTADVATNLEGTELLDFIFLPGFSTAEAVTDISGRGVGLDAVRTAVEAVAGSVSVTSEEESGTTFHLRLPVTRSVIRAVVAEVGGEAYAFPMTRLERVLKLHSDEVQVLGQREYFALGDGNVSLVGAQQLLGVGVAMSRGDDVCVVVVADRSRRFGIVVDRFLGEQDLVVRPLDARLGKVHDISAAAILMDGSPALILDVDDLVRSIQRLVLDAGNTPAMNALAAPPERKRILVVDDSITVREAERQLLLSRGYRVDVAVDGMDGWNSFNQARYDLVVSDIDMPRMNGLDLVRSIKRSPTLGAVPVVIVSYKDRDEDRLAGLDAGANYYLAKSSFQDDTLVQVVEELIGVATS